VEENIFPGVFFFHISSSRTSVPFFLTPVLGQSSQLVHCDGWVVYIEGDVFGCDDEVCANGIRE